MSILKACCVFIKKGVHLKKLKKDFFFKRQFDLHTMHISPLKLVFVILGKLFMMCFFTFHKMK